jgi:hypothetical protein
MTFRSILQGLIWASCLVFVLLGAKRAQAAAPMCDERGASAIAPPPVLPIRDVKIDTGSPLGCDDPSPAVAPLGPRARTQAVVVDESSDDACLRVEQRAMPKPAPVLFSVNAARELANSSGHERGVFRPPRP